MRRQLFSSVRYGNVNERLRQTISAEIVALIRAERERQGISMNRLSECAGLHHASISLIERGLRNPSLDTLVRIALVLKIDLGDIVNAGMRAAKRKCKTV